MMGRTAESVGARVHWTKSHGLGNDYLVVEPAHLPPGVALTPATVRLICDRHRVATTGGDATVALALADDERVAAVTVDMGTASFDPRETIPVEGQALTVSILSVGNPHCVVIVPDLDAVPFARLGPAIERHPAFPARTNVQFAQPMSDRVVRALIWERGAGETQASGSSACAVAAACHRRGLVGREVTVAMPGGDLTIRIGDAGRLWLHGPVEETCRGTFSAELVARLRALEA
jgi:diaminopimelate epimerase